MHKLTKVPNTSISTRCRSLLPEISEIEHLIGQTRTLRLELTRLVAFEPLGEAANAAVDALRETGDQLERIAETLVSTKNRRRHRPRARVVPPAPVNPEA
jgi:hypothetical protein